MNSPEDLIELNTPEATLAIQRLLAQLPEANAQKLPPPTLAGSVNKEKLPPPSKGGERIAPGGKVAVPAELGRALSEALNVATPEKPKPLDSATQQKIKNLERLKVTQVELENKLASLKNAPENSEFLSLDKRYVQNSLTFIRGEIDNIETDIKLATTPRTSSPVREKKNAFATKNSSNASLELKTLLAQSTPADTSNLSEAPHTKTVVPPDLDRHAKAVEQRANAVLARQQEIKNDFVNRINGEQELTELSKEFQSLEAEQKKIKEQRAIEAATLEQKKLANLGALVAEEEMGPPEPVSLAGNIIPPTFKAALLRIEERNNKTLPQGVAKIETPAVSTETPALSTNEGIEPAIQKKLTELQTRFLAIRRQADGLETPPETLSDSQPTTGKLEPILGNLKIREVPQPIISQNEIMEPVKTGISVQPSIDQTIEKAPSLGDLPTGVVLPPPTARQEALNVQETEGSTKERIGAKIKNLTTELLALGHRMDEQVLEYVRKMGRWLRKNPEEGLSISENFIGSLSTIADKLPNRSTLKTVALAATFSGAIAAMFSINTEHGENSQQTPSHNSPKQTSESNPFSRTLPKNATWRVEAPFTAPLVPKNNSVNPKTPFPPKNIKNIELKPKTNNVSVPPPPQPEVKAPKTPENSGAWIGGIPPLDIGTPPQERPSNAIGAQAFGPQVAPNETRAPEAQRSSNAIGAQGLEPAPKETVLPTKESTPNSIPIPSSGAMDEETLYATPASVIRQFTKEAENRPPAEIFPKNPDILNRAKEIYHGDIDALLHSEAIFGGEIGTNTLHWKSPEVGFSHKTVNEVLQRTSSTPTEGKQRRFGIESTEATLKMQAYLINVANKTQVTATEGEKISDYLERAIAELLSREATTKKTT